MIQQILDGKAKTKKRRILKHISKVGISMIFLALMTSVAGAIELKPGVNPSNVPKDAPSFFQKSKKAVKFTGKFTRKIITSKPFNICSGVGLFYYFFGTLFIVLGIIPEDFLLDD